MKKLMLVTLTIFLSVSLFGCKNKENNPVKKEEKESEIVQEEPTPIYAPLTGNEIEQTNEQRPVAVMVNNYYLARPQSGLSSADIVYELLAEGDITRLLAIFQSNIPEKIGPVRSARDYYIELAKGYHALYICHGYSPKAKQMLAAGEVDSLNGLFYDGSLFKRDSNRRAPHNSYIMKEGIEKGVKEKKYSYSENVEPLLFTHDEIVFDDSWSDVTKAIINYSNDNRNNVLYQYNASEKQFSRSQNNVTASDALNDKKLAIKNILVLEASHKVLDSSGRRSIDIKKGGSGYYITEGKMKKVKWKNIENRIIPYDEVGDIALMPGQTWINFVPSFDIVKIQ